MGLGRKRQMRLGGDGPRFFGMGRRHRFDRVTVKRIRPAIDDERGKIKMENVEQPDTIAQRNRKDPVIKGFTREEKGKPNLMYSTVKPSTVQNDVVAIGNWRETLHEQLLSS
jgi:hypothetical protein